MRRMEDDLLLFQQRAVFSSATSQLGRPQSSPQAATASRGLSQSPPSTPLLSEASQRPRLSNGSSQQQECVTSPHSAPDEETLTSAVAIGVQPVEVGSAPAAAPLIAYKLRMLMDLLGIPEEQWVALLKAQCQLPRPRSPWQQQRQQDSAGSAGRHGLETGCSVPGSSCGACGAAACTMDSGGEAMSPAASANH